MVKRNTSTSFTLKIIKKVKNAEWYLRNWNKCFDIFARKGDQGLSKDLWINFFLINPCILCFREDSQMLMSKNIETSCLEVTKWDGMMHIFSSIQYTTSSKQLNLLWVLESIILFLCILLKHNFQLNMTSLKSTINNETQKIIKTKEEIHNKCWSSLQSIKRSLCTKWIQGVQCIFNKLSGLLIWLSVECVLIPANNECKHTGKQHKSGSNKK